MAPASITTTTFTLKQGATAVPGTVTYSGVTAVFTPTGNLAANTVYTATITTGAKDLSGKALASDYVTNFTTGAVADTTAPTVTITVPVNAAATVPIGNKLTVTFGKTMDPATITGTTFTVMQGQTAVPGTVTYTGVSAVFTPTGILAASTVYTATITTGAKDLAGNALANDYVWSFTTGTAIANPTAPDLGEAGRFVILASQAVTTTSGSTISNGDIGVEDQARSFITGFTAGAIAGQFTELTNGMSYASNDANPAPFAYPLHYATPVVGAPWATTGAMITQAKTDLGIANTFLAAATNPGAPTQDCPIQLGGLILNRGVYLTANGVQITTGPLHLDAQGDPNAVFIFSIGGTLTTGASGSIVLDNGAQAKNVYFRTAGTTTIAAGTTFYGNVFAATQVNVLAGANVTGRLFAVTDRVTLISNKVTKAP
jgi:hypothetical protein